ncbi:BnaA04g10010D [Brassica napus]|uniref:(rape) hypothetical protein n=1 Tax=Brassica napus TaxID=3708 RepID=A0A078I539_BRANA|nr:unnamed protein product [Brassica napus]CDY44589.1 BnaA04g10010D [Brassica napus]
MGWNHVSTCAIKNGSSQQNLLAITTFPLFCLIFPFRKKFLLIDGASALHYAVQVGALQTVKLLIKYNVDVNVTDNARWTPLHIAVQNRNRDITKILLTNGADKTRRTKDGKVALDMALCFGRDLKS